MSNELIGFCLEYMASHYHLDQLMDLNGIRIRTSDSYTKRAGRFFADGESQIPLEALTQSFRERWRPCPQAQHFDNLKSGKLQGHSWHKMMPSNLHLRFQGMVRECVDGQMTLDDLLDVGTDIARHEYFMVATHDLIETAIIQTFDDAIPPSRDKSLADFVFRGVPYDLKNTNYLPDWTKAQVLASKQAVATELISGADTNRLRADAKKHRWGSNRFFVLVEDQDRWLNEPEALIAELMAEAEALDAPIMIPIDDVEITVHVVAV